MDSDPKGNAQKKISCVCAFQSLWEFSQAKKKAIRVRTGPFNVFFIRKESNKNIPVRYGVSISAMRAVDRNWVRRRIRARLNSILHAPDVRYSSILVTAYFRKTSREQLRSQCLKLLRDDLGSLVSLEKICSH